MSFIFSSSIGFVGIGPCDLFALMFLGRLGGPGSGPAGPGGPLPVGLEPSIGGHRVTPFGPGSGYIS